MTKNNIKIMIIIIMIITLLGCNKKEPKQETLETKLINTITVYKYEDNKWQEKEKHEYEYNNKYPSIYRYINIEKDNTTEYSYKYTFNKNKPETMKAYNKNKLELEIEYQEGKRYNEKDYINNKTILYQYPDDNYYYTQILINENKQQEINSITIDTNNNLLKKTTCIGINNKDKWNRNEYSYIAEYNGNGIINYTTKETNDKKNIKEYKYEIIKKDRQISEIIKQHYNIEDNKWYDEIKYIIEYTDIKIDKIRYSMMINDIISEDYYYKYNWY